MAQLTIDSDGELITVSPEDALNSPAKPQAQTNFGVSDTNLRDLSQGACF